jgi:hypothetical protein
MTKAIVRYVDDQTGDCCLKAKVRVLNEKTGEYHESHWMPENEAVAILKHEFRSRGCLHGAILCEDETDWCDQGLSVWIPAKK